MLVAQETFRRHVRVYERLKPADSIYYFILGNSGKLMTNDFRSRELMEKGFDTDQGFMLVEISGNRIGIFRQSHALERLSIRSGLSPGTVCGTLQ